MTNKGKWNIYKIALYLFIWYGIVVTKHNESENAMEKS